MRAFHLLAFVLFFAAVVRADEAALVRVTCVGDSITYGAGLPDRQRQSYPAQLQEMLGKSWVVSNFGHSGASAIVMGGMPYSKLREYTAAMASSPDIVLLMLGTNDTKPFAWDNATHFNDDYRQLIRDFRSLPSKPRVILLLPVPVVRDAMSIRKQIMDKEIIPRIRQIAFEESCEMIDLHTALVAAEAHIPDLIHPDADGARLMAARVARTLTMKSDDHFDFEKSLAAQGDQPVQNLKKTSFYGYETIHFTWNQRACRVVKPRRVAEGRPYIWRMAFFGHEPQADLGLLEAGWHVVEVNVDDMLGCPDAVGVCHEFQSLLTRVGLNPRAALEGMSRGGLYTTNYALVHPNDVMAIYNDNPVLDLKSWPGGKGKGEGSPRDWQLAQKVYGLNEAQLLQDKINPLDRAAELAKSKIPILIVAGTADTVVPIDENTRPFAQAYKDTGGPITVIEKPGMDHHPHSLVDPEPIITFLLKSAASKGP